MGMKTGILIALLLLSTLTLTFHIQPVKVTGTRPNGSPQQTAVDSWPMFRHDLRHSGYSTSKARDNNHTLWSFQTGGWVRSSPAVADGKVYVGSTDSKVYALDASTGAPIWNSATGCIDMSSPAVADGKVYVGSTDSKVYALDALTGGLIWSYQTGSVVYSSPAVADGKVYVGGGSSLYAFDALTGAFIWSYQTGDWVLSSPAVADGKVYVGSANPVSSDGKVYALDALTGGFIWSYQTGIWVLSSPAVADGKVYVGSDDGQVLAFGASHDVAITNVTPSKTVADQGYEADTNVTVTNQGDFTETFNVTLYAKTEQAINEAGLVGYWKFDEGTGTIAHDSSVNGNDGILMNDPTWVDGIVGKALRFDQLGQYINVLDSNSLDIGTSDFTLAAWVYSEDRSGLPYGAGAILSKTLLGWPPPGYFFGISNNGSICFELTRSPGGPENFVNGASNVPVPMNEWHYVAITFQRNGNAIFYLDGNQVGSVDISSEMGDISNDRPLLIGESETYSNQFKGVIDEVKIYNRCLSTEEVWAEYTHPNTGLVGYWKFDEGTGTTAYDSSGNGNDGTLINGPTWVDGKLGKALSFDGIDDYVEIPDSPELKLDESKGLTIMLWFYRTSYPQHDNVLVSKQSASGRAEYQLDLVDTGALEFKTYSDDNVAIGSVSVPDANEWYHVAYVMNGTQWDFYVNGTLENSGTTPYDLYVSDGNVTIGKDFGFFTAAFNGTIDDVEIYSRALSAGEIWAEYTRSPIAIQTQTVTLESGASTTLTFNWNTTGFAKGNYNISAVADSVPGETDLSDNTFVDDSIYVAMLGDITADGKVDIFDIVIVALHFNHIPPDDHWPPGTPDYFNCFNADINNDGIIDIFDIVIVALHFGEVDP